MTGEWKKHLSFKNRYELGKDWLKHNPNQAKVIVEWIITP